MVGHGDLKGEEDATDPVAEERGALEEADRVGAGAGPGEPSGNEDVADLLARNSGTPTVQVEALDESVGVGVGEGQLGDPADVDLVKGEGRAPAVKNETVEIKRLRRCRPERKD